MSEFSEQAVEGEKVRRRHVRANAPNKAFTLPQLAADGPLCRSALYREINAGRLMARKAGRSTIVLAADWDAYLRALPRLGADVAVTEPTGPREARAKRRTIAT